jgi:transposase
MTKRVPRIPLRSVPARFGWSWTTKQSTPHNGRRSNSIAENIGCSGETLRTWVRQAEAVGVSLSSVQRIWQAHGLQRRRVRRFKLSKDPEFVPKLREIVGLYVNPPAHAIVLSVDENSQIQALDRTQPGLPMKKGRAGTLTHDYKRRGTTTIEAEIPVGKIMHVVLDNYATHKHPKVRAWLARHPRFVSHFTPKSCSWLNAVETLFSRLTRRRFKRGVFRSIAAIIDSQSAKGAQKGAPRSTRRATMRARRSPGASATSWSIRLAFC